MINLCNISHCRMSDRATQSMKFMQTGRWVTFKCTASGSILVLCWSSLMLCLLVCTSERDVPESIRALNLLPAYTVAVGKSDTSPMMSWFEECPPYSSSSLLGESPCNLKDQSHCLNLMKSLK